jgi:ABC-type phosphate transport system substrate-binding protein
MMKPIQHLLLGLLCLSGTSALFAGDYLLIVNPDVAAISITREEAKSILLGGKFRWDTGANIQLAVLSGGATHEKAISELTARSADQFDKYWKKQVFSGKGVMPEIVADDAAMVAYVARTPGAFGYVSAGAATTGVKTLALP